MKYITEALKTPIADEVDVLVLGSGPAGVSAAVAAARQGVRVMIVEQGGAVGGIATSGLMSHWAGTADSGIYREILKKSSEGELTITIDPERLKTVLLNMLHDAGVIIRLYTFACGALKDGNRVSGVVLESKSGREAVLSKVVIDATGDGDIAAKAGVPYRKGRETDGKMQPATMMFKVGGVDCDHAVFLSSVESTYETEKGELQALARKHIPAPAGHVLLYRTTVPGVVTCNMTNCTGVDGTSAADLTHAEFVCRNQLDAIVKFLREYVSGYEKCFVISSSSLMGIRETRHFEGEYTITENDILESRVFDDWAVRNASFNFDVHNIDGSGLDKNGVQKHFPKISGYTIPYRCFVPKEIDGLLLSGRNISGTHIAHSNFRVMPICAAIGEAGGIAAAIAVKNNINVREVKAADIQKHF